MTVSKGMPKFDFSGLTTEAVEGAISKASEGTKYDGPRSFRPGLYDVQIKDIENKGVAEDTNWLKIVIHYVGSDNRTTSDLLMVPTGRSLTMKTVKDPASTAPLRRLKNFIETLGIEVNSANLGATITELFSGEALLGKNVKIKIDFRGNHIAFEGKDDVAGVKYSIQLAGRGANKQLVPGTKDVMMFVGRDAYKAAEAKAAELNIVLEKYTRVVGYERSAESNDFSSSESNW